MGIEELPGWSFFNAKCQFCVQAANKSKQAALSGHQGKGPGCKQGASQKCIVEVLPGLFLGSREAELDLQTLQDRAITHILQVAYEVVPSHAGLNRFVYKHVPVYDMEAEDLVNTFEGSFAFIDEALKAGHRVLCHCLAGNSRSATTVLAYMMWHKQMGLGKAMAQLKGLRPSVNPNAGFRLQLEWFEDAGFPNPPSGWQGWDLGIFLQRHNAGHRHRQERFKQQQEAHKQRVQERKQQQQQQRRQAQAVADTQQQSSLVINATTVAATPPPQQQQQGGNAVSSPSSTPGTPFSTLCHALSTPAAAADADADCMSPSPYASASPAILLCGSSPKASLNCPRGKGGGGGSQHSHKSTGGQSQHNPCLQTPPYFHTPTSPKALQQQQQQQQQQYNDVSAQQSHPVSPSPNNACHTLVSAFALSQHDHDTPAAKQQQEQQQEQQEGQQQLPQSPNPTNQELDFAIITDPDFMPSAGKRLLSPSAPGSYPFPPPSSQPSSEAHSWGYSHQQQQQQQQSDYQGALSSPSLCLHRSALCASGNQHSAATADHPSSIHNGPLSIAAMDPPLHSPTRSAAADGDPAAPLAAAHHTHHIATADTPCSPAHAPHASAPASSAAPQQFLQTAATSAPAGSSSMVDTGAAMCAPTIQHHHTAANGTPAAASSPASAAASMPARDTDLAPTPRASESGVAEGQEDCFRTPERARHLPCQQQFFGGGRGGALRVLLSKKSSLNMATPGSPSSPHLDATPSRVDEGQRGPCCLPFHSPRHPSTLTPQRSASGTSSLHSRPFLTRLPQPSFPPAQPACLDPDHEFSGPEEQQQQQPTSDQCTPRSFFASSFFELDSDVSPRHAALGSATQSAGPPASASLLSATLDAPAATHPAAQQDTCLTEGWSSASAEPRKDAPQPDLSRHAHSMPFTLHDTHNTHTLSLHTSLPVTTNRRCSAPGVQVSVPAGAPLRTEQCVGGTLDMAHKAEWAAKTECAPLRTEQQLGGAPVAAHKPLLSRLGSTGLGGGAVWQNGGPDEVRGPASAPLLGVGCAQRHGCSRQPSDTSGVCDSAGRLMIPEPWSLPQSPLASGHGQPASPENLQARHFAAGHGHPAYLEARNTSHSTLTASYGHPARARRNTPPATAGRPARLLHLGSSLEVGAGLLQEAVEEAARSWRGTAKEGRGGGKNGHLGKGLMGSPGEERGWDDAGGKGLTGHELRMDLGAVTGEAAVAGAATCGVGDGGWVGSESCGPASSSLLTHYTSPAAGAAVQCDPPACVTHPSATTSSPQLHLAPSPRPSPPRPVSLLSPHASIVHQLPPHDYHSHHLQQEQQHLLLQPCPLPPTADATLQNAQQQEHAAATFQNHPGYQQQQQQQQQRPYHSGQGAGHITEHTITPFPCAASRSPSLFSSTNPATPACTVSLPPPHSAGATNAPIAASATGNPLARADFAMPPPLAALSCSAAGTAAGATAGQGSSGRKSADAVRGMAACAGRRQGLVHSAGAAGAAPAVAGSGRGGADDGSSMTRQSSGSSSNSAAAGKKLSLTDSVLMSMKHSVSESVLAMVGEASGEEGRQSEVGEVLRSGGDLSGGVKVWDLDLPPAAHGGGDKRGTCGESCAAASAHVSAPGLSIPQSFPLCTEWAAAAHGSSAVPSRPTSARFSFGGEELLLTAACGAAAQRPASGRFSLGGEEQLPTAACGAAVQRPASGRFSLGGGELLSVRQHAGQAGTPPAGQRGSAPQVARPIRHSYCGME